MSKYSVFVYGSLMSGLHNHDLLGDSPYAGKAMVDGFTMFDLGSFPAAVPGPGAIIGEVYVVTKDVLDDLDRLEGTPDLYQRVVSPLRCCAAQCAYMYIMSRGRRFTKRVVVPGGNWRTWTDAKKSSREW